MKNRTGNHGRLASRNIAGLVLLLVLGGWPPTAAAQMTQSDWPRVQDIKPGTPITVVLHKDQGPRGDRKVRGRFHSTTDDSLTLTLKDGQRRTFSKWAVRKVLVRLRPGERYLTWIAAAAVSTAIMVPFGAWDEDNIVAGSIFWFLMVTGIAYLVDPKMGGISNVPPKYRIQPPVDKSFGAQDESPTKKKNRQ